MPISLAGGRCPEVYHDSGDAPHARAVRLRYRDRAPFICAARVAQLERLLRAIRIARLGKLGLLDSRNCNCGNWRGRGKKYLTYLLVASIVAVMALTAEERAVLRKIQSRGGRNRAKKLTPERRREIALLGVAARQRKRAERAEAQRAGAAA